MKAKMKKLFNYLIIPALIFLLCGSIFAINIDDFENDLSLGDQDGVADANWWTPSGEITRSINTDTTYTYNNSSASLKVEYNKVDDRWAFFGAGDLVKVGNVHNFSGESTISCWVYGRVKIMVKFRKWGSEDSTSDLSVQEATNATGWTKLTWDFSKVNWGSVDPNNIGDIIFYPQPGYKESGVFYIDNLTLGPDTTSLSSSQKNFVLDDFNDGRDPNNIGGISGVWPDDRVMKVLYLDSVPEQIHGRTGNSLLMWYGAEYAHSGDSGRWTNLERSNLSNFSALSMWIVGADGGETVRIGLRDLTGQETIVNVSDYLSSGITKSWQKVIIPLSAFTNVNLEQLEGTSIRFDAWHRGMIFVDDIVFHSTMTGCSFNNFNDSADPNAFGGYQGNLEDGVIEYFTDAGGSRCCKVTSNNPLTLDTTGGSMVDDFRDGDLDNFFGENNWFWKTDPATISTVAAAGYVDDAWGLVFNTVGQKCGFALNTADRDVTKYTTLEFWVKGGAGGEKFAVGIKDGNGIEPKLRVDGSTYITDGTVTTSWKRVKIPLADIVSSGTAINSSFSLSEADLVSITFDDEFGSPKSGTVCVDEIEFRPGIDGGWMTLNGADISACDKLTFWANASGCEKLRIKLQSNPSSFVESNEYGVSDDEAVTLANGWNKYEIALSNFTGIDKTNMNAIHIIAPRGCDVFYIDDLRFEDSSSPTAPTELKVNGVPIQDEVVFTLHNVLSATADSCNEDGTLEAVRFEYSSDGITWCTAGTDYDINDNTYSAGWNASDFIGNSGYYFRAVAQDVYGNETYSATTYGHSFIGTPVLVYPNPYYPYSGTRMIHFLQIPKNAVVKIYTLSAELICTRSDDGYCGDEHANDGKLSWDGKNNSGNLCASGIYLYNVILNKKKYASGKFVIIK